MEIVDLEDVVSSIQSRWFRRTAGNSLKMCGHGIPLRQKRAEFQIAQPRWTDPDPKLRSTAGNLWAILKVLWGTQGIVPMSF